MNIFVIGESSRDITVFGSCERICPEGPVPVFVPDKVEERSGMAGNVYANAKNISDRFWGDTIHLMTSTVMPVKRRFVDEASGQLVLRVDQNDKVPATGFTEEIQNYIEHADAVIVSDYGKGYLNVDTLRKISQLAKDEGIPSFLDTKKIAGIWAENFTFVKINQKEFNENGWADHPYQKMIVTCGANGCLVNDEMIKAPHVMSVRDVTGAGDTFLAAFSLDFLHNGGNVKSAVNYAQSCCATVIQKQGVAVPYGA